MDEFVSDAWQSAAAFARRAGVEVRMLDSLEEFDAAIGLLDQVWGNGAELLHPNLMTALRHTGNYLAGAFAGDADDPVPGFDPVPGLDPDVPGLDPGRPHEQTQHPTERMVGFCFGFRSVDESALHSHFAAVTADKLGRSIGSALKFHQRAWCLERGIDIIEWTYDPLVARNAVFNLIKLGADAESYLVDFYGAVDDEINRGEPSDRLMARWHLSSPKVVDAGRGVRAGVDPQAWVKWVEVPPDIENLRVTNPELASEWRLRVREELAGPMAEGARILGFDPARGYALED
ncbi:MAG: hypothetical protein LBR21_05110 [Propionibacteriaceae bacterium]|jgi:predicted GNAT superfamily acetyltransferase|nr:hypothetical protein [Propionibacteriaceae bacterium]